MLSTKRLYLRESIETDVERFYEIYSDEKAKQYLEALSDDREEEKEIIIAYKNMYHFYGYGMWTICLKDNDRIIGRAGFENFEMDGENVPELGYVIDQEYRNKGLAYEICSAICEHAKEYMCVSRIICMIQKDNEASIGLALKLGFEKINPVRLNNHKRIQNVENMTSQKKDIYLLQFHP
ncbi:MAG: GNAT family N-acetyltransferase [Lachnospiraceae bacterium]|nr:GNAT family N-acetyltransferase [Lachnospiraceae bacterium]